MKPRIAHRASLILVGAILLLMVPITDAFALATISSVTPAASPRGVQIPNVQINGSGFTSLFTPTVTFGTGIGVGNVRVQSGSTLLVDIDISSTAPFGAHTVTVDDGLGSPSSCQCFTVTPPPTVSDITPTSLAAGGGPITYTISGTGFLTGAVVVVSGNGVTAGSTTVAGDGKSLTVPLTAASNAIPSQRNVTVTNTDGQSGSCADCFLLAGPPRAGGFFPAQRAQGLTHQQIDIVGSGFDSTTTVTFSGSGITMTSGTSIQLLNSSYLRMTIDVASDAPLGARDVTFDNSDNGGHSVCTGCFAVTGPTTISIETPSTVNGSIVATFSQPVSGVAANNSFVRYTGHTYNLPTTISCRDQDGSLVDCTTGYVTTATLKPTSLITPGQHYTVHIAFASNPAIVDFGGLTVAETMQDFRGGLFQQGEGAATTFGWRLVKTSSAFGGSYVVDNVPGAVANYRFTGSWITWYTNIGPNYGIADLYVDGVLRATANSYSPTTHYRAAFTVSGFPYGRHTLMVRARGRKGSSHGTGTDVAVDAFRSGRSIIASPSLTYAWGIVKATSAYAGAYSWDDEGGATASFTFRGTSIEWDTVLGPQMGRAWVYIDGVRKLSADNYAATTTYGVSKIFTGLTDGVHTIKIVVLGTHRSGATGSYVAVDRWVVG